MRSALTIGSRGSALALWQARHVAALLEQLEIDTTIEIIKTTGDHLAAASLVTAGGKGLFTKELEEALLDGRIDLAVHSLKDLPTEMRDGLAIAAVPEREDPRDALVGHTLRSLAQGATVGTSSPRRTAQLLAMRPDLRMLPIRGNVDTRLRKLKDGEYSAILLAAAGLRRLGLGGAIAQLFTADEICCAPGQGALAIQTRVEGTARDICARLNHVPSEQAVICERAVLAGLGGGCQAPVGAYAEVTGSEIYVTGVVASPDGKSVIRAKSSGQASEAVAHGYELAGTLLAQGAAKIISMPAAARL